MKLRVLSGLSAIASAALLSAAANAGTEEAVALDAVPANVMEIAKARLADLEVVRATSVVIEDDSSILDDEILVRYEALGPATLVSANTETEDDGAVVYEIQATVQGGRKVEIDITPDGAVDEIEIEFRLEDVPGAVLNAIESKLPGFRAEFIEASHSSAMKVVGYEFVGMLGAEKMDIEVSADGRTITVADE